MLWPFTNKWQDYQLSQQSNEGYKEQRNLATVGTGKWNTKHDNNDVFKPILLDQDHFGPDYCILKIGHKVRTKYSSVHPKHLLQNGKITSNDHPTEWQKPRNNMMRVKKSKSGIKNYLTVCIELHIRNLKH